MAYEIIYMKADYEPWWLFDGWEKSIRKRESFETVEEAKDYLNTVLKELESVYPFKREKHNCFFAFWTESERMFCEGCDEDLQLYHGIILMIDGKPAPFM